MSSCATLNNFAPLLNGEFSLISTHERLEWRDALSRNVLQQMKLPDGNSLPDWKIEEQVASMNLAVASLIERGLSDPQAITEFFTQDNLSGTHHAISE